MEERGGQKLLEDPLMHVATAEIETQDKTRGQIAKEIKNKERARDHLAQKYATAQLSNEAILTCLYSIGDNCNYLRFNRDPIDRMIFYLQRFFRPDQVESPEFSLGISVGAQGARLSHNHERQYNYVLQSLTLWREIATDMFKLWYLAEEDLLREGNHYRLTDTGQARLSCGPPRRRTAEIGDSNRESGPIAAGSKPSELSRKEAARKPQAGAVPVVAGPAACPSPSLSRACPPAPVRPPPVRRG